MEVRYKDIIINIDRVATSSEMKRRFMKQIAVMLDTCIGNPELAIVVNQLLERYRDALSKWRGDVPESPSGDAPEVR